MNEGYIIAGLLLLTAGMIDFLWTTLWLESGAGPITRCLSAWLWKGCRKISGDHAKVLSMAGPLLLCLTLVIWISLFWGGWVLIYSSDPHSLMETQSKEPASWSDRIYFSGYVMFTLGNGDLAPKQYQPNQLHIKEARSSIKNYLDTVHTAYIHPAEQAPPEPDISKLQQSGIPALSKQTFQIAVNSIKECRQLLLGIIQAGARKWPVQEQAIGNAYSPK
ncbi:potassium channel family protein [Bacillus subtilis]|uniref:potassium channel family protein n=1 Tax=Bacillus subtilis TaxID=1423 RepID=UPI0021554927|nr:potassium channel family protein [Bacillus subtilis]UVB76213.1 potassium channel family protein [Bacillus subtilis]